MWCLARENAKGVYFGLVWTPLYRDIQTEIDRCGGVAEFRLAGRSFGDPLT